ncbi:snare protein [Aspergillus pseudoustus]|uniref:Snare protein n=1 Tax=Aspergillus pseudoustus TaxID=1810923 RepID=A0ABR4KWJ7_9EURO
MTDLTPTFTDLLHKENKSLSLATRPLTTETADEFLKEAYRINTHIASLLSYLHKIRPSYLSISTHSSTTNNRNKPHHRTTASTSTAREKETLSPTELDNITTSTSSLLHTLSSSISNLSSAESLRQETHSTLLDKKYGRKRSRASNILFQWASGSSPLSEGQGDGVVAGYGGKKEAQIVDEQREELLKGVRESILWYLRRQLENTIETQREMVEKRIERAKEREKSVLYKASTSNTAGAGGRARAGSTAVTAPSTYPETGFEVELRQVGKGEVLDESEVAAIEAELSPEQLQLFAEENDTMVRYYEDTLSKVQNAEKSLLEISSLQQTLVTHLSTQEEYVGQLVYDAEHTETNIGRGNKELKRATERRSVAQAVFWGTVGLCTWLVVWDLIF